MRLIDANKMREDLVWCKSQASRYDDYWDDVIERLDAQPTISGWVSVKDRMPDKPCGCLVFNIYGWRELDFWEGDGWAISDENEITHWIPLPPGPEVDK